MRVVCNDLSREIDVVEAMMVEHGGRRLRNMERGNPTHVEGIIHYWGCECCNRPSLVLGCQFVEAPETFWRRYEYCEECGQVLSMCHDPHRDDTFDLAVQAVLDKRRGIEH